MDFQLRVIEGPDCGSRFVVCKAHDTVIGRGFECTVTLADPSVSRKHCRIVVEKGKVTLHDADSRWGTLVNEQPATCQELGIGDQISVGETILRLETAAAPDATTMERAETRQRQASMKLEPLPPTEPSIHR